MRVQTLNSHKDLAVVTRPLDVSEDDCCGEEAPADCHDINYPGAGHLIEPPFSPHCRVARLNKKSTSCSCQEKALPSYLLTQDALTEVCVCVCFSYIGARGTNQTSLRRPGGRLVEDLGLPTASSILHSLRQHGEEQRNKKNLSSRRL